MPIKPPDKEPSPPVRIGLVEDEMLVRDLLTQRLEQNPAYEIIFSVSSGERGVALAREHEPDVLLLDLGLPGIKGYEVALSLCEDIPHTRILIVSNRSEPDIILPILRIGVAGFVHKVSSTMEFLVEAVNAVASGENFYSPDIRPLAAQALLNPPDAPPTLSVRQVEILRLLTQGKSSREIAPILGLSPRTIDHHRAAMMKLLNLHGIAELTAYALRTGLI